MYFVHPCNRCCAAGDGAIRAQENAVIPCNRRLRKNDAVDFRLTSNTLRDLTDINSNRHLFARKRLNHKLLHLINAALRFGECAHHCRDRRCRGTYCDTGNVHTGKISDKLNTITINIITTYLNIPSTNTLKRLEGYRQDSDNVLVALLAS